MVFLEKFWRLQPGAAGGLCRLGVVFAVVLQVAALTECAQVVVVAVLRCVVEMRDGQNDVDPTPVALIARHVRLAEVLARVRAPDVRIGVHVGFGVFASAARDARFVWHMAPLAFRPVRISQ